MFGRNNKLDTEWLSKVSFFHGFSQSELEAVSALGERQEVGTGAVIVDQGRVGDSCYVIVEGSAGIYIRDEFVTSIGHGAIFGEMALVEYRPRNASVISETDMVLVAFGTAEFRKLLKRSPNAEERVMTIIQARLRANEARQQN